MLGAAGLLAACSGEAPAGSPPSEPASPTTQSAVAAASPTPTPTPSPGQSHAGFYLALGDSLAAGVGAPAGQGYVDLIHAELVEADPGVELVNLGVSGETTGSALAAGGQLERAERVLRERGEDVALVTVDLGANDGWGCLISPDPACLDRALGDVQVNLEVVLDRLRAAGGDTLPIAGMDYYLPLPPQLREDPDRLAAALDLGERLNDGLADAYASHGVPVAPVGAAFGGSDPERVAELACDYTLMCGPVPDIHPSPEGHRAIADAFLDVLPPPR